MSLKQNEHFEETKFEAEQEGNDCNCDCHKVIDPDKFGGSHYCCG